MPMINAPVPPCASSPVRAPVVGSDERATVCTKRGSGTLRGSGAGSCCCCCCCCCWTTTVTAGACVAVDVALFDGDGDEDDAGAASSTLTVHAPIVPKATFVTSIGYRPGVALPGML